jgi:hypothetical protein
MTPRQGFYQGLHDGGLRHREYLELRPVRQDVLFEVPNARQRYARAYHVQIVGRLLRRRERAQAMNRDGLAPEPLAGYATARSTMRGRLRTRGKVW